MNKLKFMAASALIALLLAACGGGGGGATNSTTPTTNGTTVISGIDSLFGMESKGPVNGTVTIYALNNNGSKGSLLTSATIAGGSYSANIGNYAGPVIIEVIGSYTDEATGQTKNITADAPLRAALSNASGTISVAVTPLTELAVQKAGALTAAAIEANNKLISDIFKIDIITAQPLDPSKAAPSSATQSQKDYTLALAAISQLSHSKSDEPLSVTLASLANGITSSGMSSQTVASFKKALTDFILPGNTNNKTGIIDLSSSNLVSVGINTATYKLAITGPTNMAANAIKGLQFEIAVPTGLTVRYNPRSAEISRTGANPVIITYDPAKGETLSGIVTASTAVAAILAAPQSAFYSTFNTFNGVNVLTLALYSSTGIGAGDLATVVCDIVPGWTVPAASAFSVRNIKAVNGSAATLTDVNVTVTAN